jgi:hypothetical protein
MAPPRYRQRAFPGIRRPGRVPDGGLTQSSSRGQAGPAHRLFSSPPGAIRLRRYRSPGLILLPAKAWPVGASRWSLLRAHLRDSQPPHRGQRYLHPHLRLDGRDLSDDAGRTWSAEQRIPMPAAAGIIPTQVVPAN